MSESIKLSRLLTDPALFGSDSANTLNGDTLTDLAVAHGIHALLYSAAGNGSELKTLEPLRRSALHQAAVFQLQDKELERVCTALNQAEVCYLLIKGAALCYRIYPTPELRPKIDTDIFVDESALTDLKLTLGRIGYESIVAHDGGLVSYQTGMRYTDDYGVAHTIDIHWRLTNRHEYRDILGFEYVNASSVQVPRFPFAVNTPNDVFALSLACMHLVGHHSDDPRLIWLYDMHLLLRRMKQDEIREFVELTHAIGLEEATSQALTELDGHFRCEKVSKILSALGHAGGAPLQGESRLALLKSNLRALPTLSTKSKYLLALAFPPVDYMEKHFEPKTRLLLPWCYLRRIVRGGGRILSGVSQDAGPGRSIR